MATGLTLTGTSNLSKGQKTLIENAMVAFEPAAPDPDLISSHPVQQGHTTVNINTYARLSKASALTEGVDLSQVEQLVSNTLQLTPTEHGVIATLSKMVVFKQGDTSLVPQTGQQLAVALRQRMASDVITLYANFDKSVPGATNTLDITYFRGSVAYLMTDNDSSYGPAPMPVHASLHIEQISDIILDITDTTPRGTTTGFSDELLRRWWRGRDRLYGVEVFHGGNIPRDDEDDANGGIFHPNALAIAIAGETDVTEEADNSLRAVEYGVFQMWSEGERADPHGVSILSDAAAMV